MASPTTTLIQSLSLILLLSFCNAQPNSDSSFRPHALLLPVTKDYSTLQYTTQFNQRTPQVPVKVVVDLGGEFLWVDCDNNYISSSYSPARCKSAQCSLARSKSCSTCFSSPKPSCNNNTCGVLPYNPFIKTSTSGDLISDFLSLQSTDGSNPGPNVSVRRFLFGCGPTSLLDKLSNGSKGIAGFGRSKISLPSQFSSAFSIPRKFAICLSSSSNSPGVIIIGDGPYSMQPGIEFSSSLQYTPLLLNRVSTAGSYFAGDPSADYFIGVKSIKIGEKQVSFDKNLLSINQTDGYGGTKISTVNPYTIMERSIFKAFTNLFIEQAKARNITRVASIAPFGACFSSKNVFSTRLGASVPTIELVLQNEKVTWMIFGANSMVSVSDDVLCLGFVDGGLNPRTSIVIGGYQLENNFIQFDLARSRLGFSSLLFGRQTACSNFNFTMNA